MATQYVSILRFDTDQPVKSIRDLRGNINQYRNDLVKLDKNSIEYNQALKKLTESQNELNRINNITRNGAGNLSQILTNTTRVASSLASGFSVVTSSAALLGVNTENLQNIFVRLQATMALVQGLQGLSGLSRSFTAFTSSINNARLSFAAFNATLKANPLILVSSIIIALIASLKGLSAILADNNDKLSTLRRTQDDFNRSIAITNSELEFELELMAARGATAEEVSLIQRAALRDEIAAREENVEELRAEITEYENLIREAGKYAETLPVIEKNIASLTQTVAGWFTGDNQSYLEALKNRLDEQTNLLEQNYKDQNNLNNRFSVLEEQRRKRESERAIAEAKRLADERIEIQRRFYERLAEIDEQFGRDIENRERERARSRAEYFRTTALEAISELSDGFDEIEEPRIPIIETFNEWTSNEAIEQRREAYQNEIAELVALANNTEESVEIRSRAFDNLLDARQRYTNFDKKASQEEKKNSDNLLKVKIANQKAAVSILDSSAQIFGENTKTAKTISAASALISTLAGSAQVLGDPSLPFIQKLAAYGTIFGTGISVIRRINDVDIPGVSTTSSTASLNSEPIPTPNINDYYTPQITQATQDLNSTEEQRSSRVYVLETDIQDALDDSIVRVEETTL